MVLKPNSAAEFREIKMKESYDESYDENWRKNWREQDSFGLAIEGS
jgi:hypothetical protein